MKQVYLVGDLISNNGPANVNKMYYKYLKDNLIVCKSNKKIYRIIHFLIHVLFIKTIIVSGMSKFHLDVVKLGSKLGKKTNYLMHGDVVLENKLEKRESKSGITQRRILENTDQIICVSKKFAEYVKAEYKEYANKIVSVNNGIELKEPKEEIKEKTKKNHIEVITIGGGRPIKNNLKVCEAISKIDNVKIKFIVIGPLSLDGEKIKEYGFVEYYEQLTNEKVLEKMKMSDIYIQNSIFETFGLAVVEAINEGTKVIVSTNVGAVEVLENCKEENIINNIDDIEEIKNKIIKVINSSNEIKLSQEGTWENSAIKLKEII